MEEYIGGHKPERKNVEMLIVSGIAERYRNLERSMSSSISNGNNNLQKIAQGAALRHHGQAAYDLRDDFDVADDDIEYTNRNGAGKNKRDRRNGRIKLFQRRSMPYTWAGRDSLATRVLLKLGVVYARKARGRSQNPQHNTSNGSPNSRHRVRRKSRPTIDGTTKKDTRKLKRSKEQRYIDRLDRTSVQYKILTQDKSRLRRISKDALSKHIIPSSTHVNMFSLEEYKEGIWMLIHGLIFDIKSVLDSHPGGVECLLDCVGVDATNVFDDVGHSDIAWEMLENSCVGVLEDDSDGADDIDDGTNVEGDESGDPKLLPRSNERLVWNNQMLEYFLFVSLSWISLLYFIYLQRRKWDNWRSWS